MMEWKYATQRVVLGIDDRNAPADAFEIPAGYRQVQET